MGGKSTAQQGKEAARSQKDDYDAVRKHIVEMLEQPEYDDGSAGPVLVRLAWHSAGTYDAKTKTGGSNGAGMRYEKEGGDDANAGLQHAREFLEPVKAAHPWITYADLWILGGVVAIKEMGGPDVKFVPGRTDFVDDSKCPPRGRLPDGAQAAEHLRHVFYRMGFNDQEIVALSGAHNLGRCHADRSGFDGAWVNNPTRFSNTYFTMLTDRDWKERSWSGPRQFETKGAGDKMLMMLPTDMALIEDDKFKPWVEKYAEDRDVFFKDFADVFYKLTELGVERDGKYESAPKKSDEATGPKKSGAEADPLAKQNAKRRESKL